MRRARISTLHKIASSRGPGYLDACFKTGRIEGEWVIWDDPKVHAALRSQFNPQVSQPRRSIGCGQQRMKPESVQGFTRERTGLGTAISKVATPIARRLGMDCVDKESGKLKPESGCAKRRDKADAISNKIVDALGRIIH